MWFLLIELHQKYRLYSYLIVTYPIISVSANLLSRVLFQEVVNEMEPPVWTEKKNLPEVTKSYKSYMEKVVVNFLINY